MAVTDTSPAGPRAAARTFLEALVTGDFARLEAALEPDVTLRALLPGAYREWQGVDDVCARFETWFGDVHEYAVVDEALDMVGPKVQMRWRIRVAGPRFGAGERLVEQIAYVDTGPSGRIRTLSLLCSGYMEAAR